MFYGKAHCSGHCEGKHVHDVCKRTSAGVTVGLEISRRNMHLSVAISDGLFLWKSGEVVSLIHSSELLKCKFHRGWKPSVDTLTPPLSEVVALSIMSFGTKLILEMQLSMNLNKTITFLLRSSCRKPAYKSLGTPLEPCRMQGLYSGMLLTKELNYFQFSVQRSRGKLF